MNELRGNGSRKAKHFNIRQTDTPFNQWNKPTTGQKTDYLCQEFPAVSVRCMIAEELIPGEGFYTCRGTCEGICG